MNDSILETIKELLNADGANVFDNQLIIFINGVINEASMVGLFKDSIVITRDTTWEELIPDVEDFESIKLYIYYKVKLQWDPPQSSSVAESMKSQAEKLEWMLQANRDRYYVDV